MARDAAASGRCLTTNEAAGSPVSGPRDEFQSGAGSERNGALSPPERRLPREAAAHLWWRQESQHRERLGRLAGEADRGSVCIGGADRAVGTPDVRARWGAGVRRGWTTVAAGRDGVEVSGSARADSAADDRCRALGSVGPGGGRAAG